MLKLKIIVIDRTRSRFLREGEAFYLDRLKRYAQTEWLEVKPSKMTKGKTDALVLAEEGQAIWKRLNRRDYMISLDRKGKDIDSKGLATHIEKLSLSHDRLAFVIGGPLGLSKEVLRGAQESLSLSKLTLTHEMSRLLLLEQLYRAFTIIHKEKYHK